MTSVRVSVQDKIINIQKYIRKTAPRDELLSEYLRQQKLKNAEEEDEPSWRDKPQHGMYHRQKLLLTRSPTSSWKRLD